MARGRALTNAAEGVDEDRAGSLAVGWSRMRSSSVARWSVRSSRWGGLGRFRGGLAATDSFWSIILGTNGLLGLGGIFSAPAAQLSCLRQRKLGPPPRSSQEVVIATVLTAMYALDCLANSMICAVFLALVRRADQLGHQHRSPARRRSASAPYARGEPGLTAGARAAARPNSRPCRVPDSSAHQPARGSRSAARPVTAAMAVNAHATSTSDSSNGSPSPWLNFPSAIAPATASMVVLAITRRSAPTTSHPRSRSPGVHRQHADMKSRRRIR